MSGVSPSDRHLDREMEKGLRLHLSGRFAEAEQVYAACRAGGLWNPELLRLYGLLLLQTGRPLPAIPLLTEASRASPGDLRIKGDLGLALATVGRDEDAAPLLAQALDQDPTYETLLSGFALVHTRLGHPNRVIAVAERAFRLTGTAQGRIHAARILGAAGAPWKGVQRLLAHDRVTPLDREETRTLCDLTSQTPEPPDLAEARAACGVALRQPDAAVDGIAPVFCAAYRDDPDWYRLRATALCEVSPALVSDPTLILGLEAFVICDPVLEQLLTRFRTDILLNRTRLPPARLLTALARQGLLNEHAWSTTEAENAALTQLEARVADLSDDEMSGNVTDIAILATYRPIWANRNAPRLAAALSEAPEPWPAFARDLLVDPARVATQAERWFSQGKVPSPARGTVSRAVAEQYEENPYPRWTRADLPPPMASHALARISGARRLPERPDILVAGCGTGRHAIRLAARHPQAQVLALDLSAASLAYARIHAEALGLRNIAFRQGDILDLDSEESRFDFIECSGVLHHLEDPAAGLSALVRSLSPEGAMGLGLYSRRARACLSAARDVAEDFQPSPDGLRGYRRRIMSAPADAPERAVLASADFYSLSGCRDLIFHAMEHVFDLAEIGALLYRAGLAFTGFQSLIPSVERHYRTRFPQDVAMRDLSNWDQLEQDSPASFSAMYEFWACPR